MDLAPRCEHLSPFRINLVLFRISRYVFSVSAAEKAPAWPLPSAGNGCK
jgi:hypothetical protein